MYLALYVCCIILLPLSKPFSFPKENHDNQEHLTQLILDVIHPKTSQAYPIRDITVLVQDLCRDNVTATISNLVLRTVSGSLLVQFAKWENGSSKSPPMKVLHSGTFLIYIISNTTTDISSTLIPLYFTVATMSMRKRLPRQLWIVITNTPISYIADFYRLLWFLQKFFEVVILDIKLNTERTEVMSMTVHTYDPFKTVYTHVNLSEFQRSYLFPATISSMHGHNMNMKIINDLPRTRIMKVQNKTKIIGYLFPFYDAIQLILNTSIQGTEYNTTERLILSTSALPYMYSKNERVEDYLFPFEIDRYCLLTPVQPGVSYVHISLWSIMLTVGIGVLIVSIFVLLFYIASIVTKNRQLRHPVNIVSLILGISIIGELTSFTEQLLFLLLVVVSTRYTAMLYTELFAAVMDVEEEGNKIQSFEDFQRTNLEFASIDYIFQHYSRYVQHIPEEMNTRMTVLETGPFFDYILSTCGFGNISYLYLESRFDTSELPKHCVDALELSKYCPIVAPIVHTMVHYNPLKPRLLEIQLLVKESGLIQRSYNNYMADKMRSQQSNLTDINDDYVKTELTAIMFPFCGFILALLAFFIEILMNRFQRIRVNAKVGKNKKV